MNEGKNKREWIKNVAIIFLTIMLLLTFFSQTIMNYSLPEVAVQYVESGSITAKIRGTGTIESGAPYYVTIQQQRKVEAVNVRPGDMVQEGDVLALLSEKQSTDMEAKEQEVEAAKEAVDVANAAFESYLLSGNVDVKIMNNAGDAESSATYMKRIVNLKKQITNKEAEVADADKSVAEATNWKNAIATQIQMNNNDLNNISINTVGTAEQRKAYIDAVVVYDVAAAEVARLQEDIDYYKAMIEYYNGMNSVSDSDAYTVLLNEAELKKINADKVLDSATTDMNAKKAVLQKQVDDKISFYETCNKNLANQENAQDGTILKLQNAKAEKEKELADLQSDYSDLLTNIKDARELETLSDNITKAQAHYQELLANYEELQHVTVDTEVVAPFSGTIVSVPISAGTDTIDSPGEGKGYTIVTMQREGKGYTMEFSVTNEQANKIKVGDAAEVVNSWRYDNMVLTVTGIKNDLKNPGQGKIVTLDVKGDYITPGQNISVSVGEKSANYDMIVPNSAIREDNNGKFVLLVETKPSPLGNRYIATRVDVQVIASDDTKSAISGDLYAWSYVITTATAPVEAGQMVRLADN